MKRKDNQYMNEITRKLNEHERKCNEFEKMRKEKRHTLSQDDFLKWLETHQQPQSPVTSGTAKAWRMWYWEERDELNLDDGLWETEVKDFVDTLRNAGIKTFTVTNNSTILMENMHWFEQNGCRLTGLCKVVQMDEWDRKHKGNLMGVRFSI